MTETRDTALLVKPSNRQSCGINICW